MVPHRRDHRVLGGVLRGDELKHAGPVTGPIEKLRPQRVGHELGLALLENPVPEGGSQDGRGDDLGPDLLLAARGDDQECGTRSHPLCERVVGGRVAGMECDQDIGGSGLRGRDGPDPE
jgi:hypothetical protein